MTISTWLMILALAAGSGTSQSIEGPSTTDPSSIGGFRIETHCWINGVWYNPCPTDPTPPPPGPGPSSPAFPT